MNKFNYSDDDFVSTPEAARLAGLSGSSLCKLRVYGGGPAFHKLGRAVRYRVGDVRDWLREHRRRNTSAVN